VLARTPCSPLSHTTERARLTEPPLALFVQAAILDGGPAWSPGLDVITNVEVIVSLCRKLIVISPAHRLSGGGSKQRPDSLWRRAIARGAEPHTGHQEIFGTEPGGLPFAAFVDRRHY
jgi:hypothetical protein